MVMLCCKEFLDDFGPVNFLLVAVDPSLSSLYSFLKLSEWVSQEDAYAHATLSIPYRSCLPSLKDRASVFAKNWQRN